MSDFAFCDSKLPYDFGVQRSLWKKIGQAVSTEARAMYNLGRAGLTYWSPNINVVRDPRWGRATETPGEDPYVVGAYASNYVRGLQDVEGTENVTDLNSRPLKVSSCCKHYAAYDVDDWLGVDRYHFDAKVTEQDMSETFLKPFEMCIKDGDVSSVMCSYNKVNGIPTCADPKLLKETIRGDWDLHGYIVSDCDSLEVMVNGHKWLGDTGVDAAAQALKAGLDLDCGDYYPNFTEAAVKEGKVRVKEIDRSLNQLYVVLMRLGFFDGNPIYNSLGKKDVCSQEHIELAREAAKEGIVLLKNVDETLPFNSYEIKKLAVVGPHANATAAMIGNYAGIPCKFISPLDAFTKYGEVKYEMGCDGVKCANESLIFPAMKAAKEADVTIILAGLDLSVEAESKDRVDLLLPGYQTQFINQVAQVSKGPAILVIMSAGGVDISFAKKNNNIKAILWAGFPGEQGGAPLQMLSLDITILVEDCLLHDIKLEKSQHCRDLEYKEGEYKPSCPSVLIDDLQCKHDFEFEVEVQNVGRRDGSEVIMVYSKPPSGIASTHAKQVIGFRRVFVKAGQTEKVNFVFNVCKSLGLVDYTAYNLLPSGRHTILLGDNVVSFPLQLNLQ
ncbi:hypothetical protein M0R45_013560 [Rubus argutus]